MPEPEVAVNTTRRNFLSAIPLLPFLLFRKRESFTIEHDGQLTISNCTFYANSAGTPCIIINNQEGVKPNA